MYTYMASKLSDTKGLLPTAYPDPVKFQRPPDESTSVYVIEPVYLDELMKPKSKVPDVKCIISKDL